jgi:cell division protein ZapA
MSAPKHSVKVSILNEEFTIRSDTPPDQTKAVADYLDKAARQVMAGGNVVEANRAVILAALRVTAELFEEREASDALSGSMKEFADEMRRLLPPAKR